MEKLLKAPFVISNKMFFVWNNLELRDVTEFTPQMGFKGQMEINSLKTQCFDLFKFFFLSDKKNLRFWSLSLDSKHENH